MGQFCSKSFQNCVKILEWGNYRKKNLPTIPLGGSKLWAISSLCIAIAKCPAPALVFPATLSLSVVSRDLYKDSECHSIHGDVPGAEPIYSSTWILSSQSVTIISTDCSMSHDCSTRFYREDVFNFLTFKRRNNMSITSSSMNCPDLRCLACRIIDVHTNTFSFRESSVFFVFFISIHR